MDRCFHKKLSAQNYDLNISLEDSSLRIQLILHQNSKVNYHGKFTDDTLPPQILDKFGGVQNIYSLLEDQQSYTVKPQQGQLELNLKFSLPNGKQIVHKGTLELTPTQKQHVKNTQKTLQHDEIFAIITDMKNELNDLKIESKKRQSDLLEQIEILKNKISKQENKFLQQIQSCRQMMEHSAQINAASQTQRKQMNKIKDKISQQNEKLRNQYQDIKQTVKQQEQMIKSLSKDLSKAKKQIDQLNKTAGIYKESFKQLAEQVAHSPQIKRKKKQKISQKKYDLIKVNKLEINPDLVYVDEFEVMDNRIKFIGTDRSLTQFLIKPYPYDCTKLIITFRILRTQKNQISIGLIDNQYASEKCTKGNKNPHYIRYHGQFGSLFEGGKSIYQEGQEYGFKRGQDVCMITNFDEGWVQWFVNGQARIKHNSQNLRDKTIDWVPHIVFCNKQDLVQLIESD